MLICRPVSLPGRAINTAAVSRPMPADSTGSLLVYNRVFDMRLIPEQMFGGSAPISFRLSKVASSSDHSHVVPLLYSRIGY